MKIGSTKLEYGLCLAPMAGFSDRAMRLACRHFGAEYSVTEMVSAKAVVYGDKKTNSLARILADEGPVSLQLFGSEPAVMAEAASRLERGEQGGVPPVAIDINMGCPVHKIFSNGEGSALMRSPEKIEEIVRTVSAAVKIPTTVKLRIGVDEAHINAVECALAAEEGGAAAVCIHGRTRVQMYSGAVDRQTIKDVKKALHIPVIANGDIVSAESAISMLRDTGADALAIGRGAVGNPFLFSEIRAMMDGKTYTEPKLELRIDVALEQLRESVKIHGEQVAVREARKQIALYLRGFRGAAAIRAIINTASTYAEAEAALRSALD